MSDFDLVNAFLEVSAVAIVAGGVFGLTVGAASGLREWLQRISLNSSTVTQFHVDPGKHLTLTLDTMLGRHNITGALLRKGAWGYSDTLIQVDAWYSTDTGMKLEDQYGFLLGARIQMRAEAAVRLHNFGGFDAPAFPKPGASNVD